MKTITALLNVICFLVSVGFLFASRVRGQEWLLFAGIFFGVTAAFNFAMIPFGKSDQPSGWFALYLKRKQLEEVQRIEAIEKQRQSQDDTISLEDEIQTKKPVK